MQEYLRRDSQGAFNKGLWRRLRRRTVAALSEPELCESSMCLSL